MTTSANSPNPTNSEQSVDGGSERLFLDASETTEASTDALEPNDAIAVPAPEGFTTPGLFGDLDHLAPIADLIHSLTDYEKQRVDPATGQVLTVEQIKVDIPIELRVGDDEAGQVAVEASAPSQRTETTVLPVFHHMQLRIVKEPDGR